MEAVKKNRVQEKDLTMKLGKLKIIYYQQLVEVGPLKKDLYQQLQTLFERSGKSIISLHLGVLKGMIGEEIRSCNTGLIKKTTKKFPICFAFSNAAKTIKAMRWWQKKISIACYRGNQQIVWV